MPPAIGIAIAIPGTALSRDLPPENMGRAKSLTDSEKQVILALLEDNKSEREIAERIGRSKNAVHNVIVALRTGETRNRRGGNVL